ncbi:MAG: hypothetical protein GX556_11920 [Fibrobacter sp.]|nr:hypothetical protein [Fibrobacter sp.]
MTQAFPLGPYCTNTSSPDIGEINLLVYIYALIKKKWWILGAAVLGLVLGYAAAIKKGPVYISEAIIAAKESDDIGAPNLSGLGAIGGFMASQLNIAGNPGLDKIELILNSKKFSAELISKHNLLPIIYKNAKPKEYYMFYDTLKNNWSETFVSPNSLWLGEFVRKTYLKKESLKNKTMILSIESSDSLFSDTMLTSYLDYLNSFIQTSVQSEARENVSYLENQLITISDPLLREKLQSMIATELEKSMLVSKEAFKIVDPKYTTKNFSAARLYPLIFSFGLVSITILIVIIQYAFISGQKTEEDKELIRRIKRELFRIR